MEKISWMVGGILLNVYPIDENYLRCNELNEITMGVSMSSLPGDQLKPQGLGYVRKFLAEQLLTGKIREGL